jgi:hypothetical protein
MGFPLNTSVWLSDMEGEMTGRLRNDTDALKESEEGQKERVIFHISGASAIVLEN